MADDSQLLKRTVDFLFRVLTPVRHFDRVTPEEAAHVAL